MAKKETYWMTFDSNGDQEQTRFSLDKPTDSGDWFDVGTEIKDKRFKFKDGKPVQLKEDEYNFYLEQLQLATAKRLFLEERLELLAKSDWTQSTDSNLSDEDKKAWETYRQQLRDLPDNTKDFFNPEWPIKPGA